MGVNFVRIYGVLLLGILASSCAVSTKLRSSAIQEISANYNVLFHGEESLGQAIQALDGMEEDYGLSLSFLAPSLRAGVRDSSIFDLLDRAETKAVKAIQKHSVMRDKVEFNKHIPRAYNLLGMARLLRAAPYEAIEAFEKAKTLAPSREQLDRANWGLALARYHLGNSEVALDHLRSLQLSLKSRRLSEEVNLLIFEITRTTSPESLEALLDRAIEKGALKSFSVRSVYAMAQAYEAMAQTEKAKRLYTHASRAKGYANARFRTLASLRLATLSATDSLELFRRLAKIESRWSNYDQRFYVDHERGQWFLNQALSYENDSVSALAEQRALTAFSRSNATATERVRALNYELLAQHFFAQKDYSVAYAFYDTLVGGFSNRLVRRPATSNERLSKLNRYLEVTAALGISDSLLTMNKQSVLESAQDEMLTLMPLMEKSVRTSKGPSLMAALRDEKAALSIEAAGLLAYDFEDLQGAVALLVPLTASDFSNEIRAAALYRLHQAYMLFEKTDQAQQYANALLDEHPNSIYTLYLNSAEVAVGPLEAQLADYFAAYRFHEAYNLLEKAYQERLPLGPESLLMAAMIEAQLFGSARYVSRLEEIKQVFRNTWAQREATRLIEEVAEIQMAENVQSERYALVFYSDEQTLKKTRELAAQKLREQNYDLSAVIDPFDQQSSYLVVGWFASEAYADAFFKRNAPELKLQRHIIISQERYLLAQWDKTPLF